MSEETKELNKLYVRLERDTGEDQQDRITNNHNLLVSGMHEGTKVEYSINHSPEWRIANDPVNHLVNIELADGEYHSIRVRQAAEGKHSVYNEITNVVIDTQPPKIDYIRLEKPELSMVRTLPVFEGKTEPEVDVVVNIHKEFYITKADEEGKFSVEITETLADGKYIPKVLVTDKAGNLSTDKAVEIWHQGEEVVVGNGNIAVVDTIALAQPDVVSSTTDVNDTLMTTLLISVTDPVQSEMDSSSGSVMTFTVTASKAVLEDTVVTVSLGGQAAVPGAEGADYNALLADGTPITNGNVTLTIKAGETQASFTVDPINDNVAVAEFGKETNESVIATLNDKAGFTMGETEARGVIINGEPFAIPFLDADFNLMTGILYPGGNNTTQLVEGLGVAMGSDYDDTLYVSFWLDGTDTKTLGNVSNSQAYGENFDDSQSITTVDLGQGNDVIKVRGNHQELARVCLGEGNDSYDVGSMIGNAANPAFPQWRPYVFGEGGNDTFIVHDQVLAGHIYGGSGSDNVTIQGNVLDQSVIDLGSGRNYPSAYETTYKNSVSLGNDNNTDLETDVNVLTVKGDVGSALGITATIYGGNGQDTVNIEGKVSGSNGVKNTVIDLGAGDDTANINQLGTELAGAGTINLGIGADTVNITTMKGGTVNTGTDTDVDTVKIGTMSGGTINMGANDVVEIGKISGGKINGSSATDDTVTITGTGSTISATNVFGVENIDLGSGNRINIYKYQYNSALDKTNGQTAMYIQGDSTSKVDLGNGIGQYDLAGATWTKGATVDVDGHKYDTWTVGGSTYGGTQAIYIEQGIQII
ncbi:Ig-like domain-containing protein [Testudinibacter sp. P80/BLE/0925]|uniref:Ig-like domain-containing protein n=1 Tax=Testudinibacter sp. TW-1 TaxID=3417757 RepID=UPI003D35F45F